MKRSASVSLIAMFAALNVAADAIVLPQLSSGVWYGLIFLLAPLNGIVLGPHLGFLSTLMGVLAGHVITPRGVEEFLFTLGTPIGALVSGYAFRGKWKPVLIYYVSLLVFYFATPVAWQLPFYGMWDVYLAFLCVIVIVIVAHRRSIMTLTNDVYRLLTLSAFVGLEADVLVL